MPNKLPRTTQIVRPLGNPLHRDAHMMMLPIILYFVSLLVATGDGRITVGDVTVSLTPEVFGADVGRNLTVTITTTYPQSDDVTGTIRMGYYVDDMERLVTSRPPSTTDYSSYNRDVELFGASGGAVPPPGRTSHTVTAALSRCITETKSIRLVVVHVANQPVPIETDIPIADVTTPLAMTVNDASIACGDSITYTDIVPRLDIRCTFSGFFPSPAVSLTRDGRNITHAEAHLQQAATRNTSSCLYDGFLYAAGVSTGSVHKQTLVCTAMGEQCAVTVIQEPVNFTQGAGEFIGIPDHTTPGTALNGQLRILFPRSRVVLDFCMFNDVEIPDVVAINNNHQDELAEQVFNIRFDVDVSAELKCFAMELTSQKRQRVAIMRVDIGKPPSGAPAVMEGDNGTFICDTSDIQPGIPVTYQYIWIVGEAEIVTHVNHVTTNVDRIPRCKVFNVYGSSVWSKDANDTSTNMLLLIIISAVIGVLGLLFLVGFLWCWRQRDKERNALKLALKIHYGQEFSEDLKDTKSTAFIEKSEELTKTIKKLIQDMNLSEDFKVMLKQLSEGSIIAEYLIVVPTLIDEHAKMEDVGEEIKNTILDEIKTKPDSELCQQCAMSENVEVETIVVPKKKSRRDPCLVDAEHGMVEHTEMQNLLNNKAESSTGREPEEDATPETSCKPCSSSLQETHEDCEDTKETAAASPEAQESAIATDEGIKNNTMNIQTEEPALNSNEVLDTEEDAAQPAESEDQAAREEETESISSEFLDELLEDEPATTNNDEKAQVNDTEELSEDQVAECARSSYNTEEDTLQLASKYFALYRNTGGDDVPVPQLGLDQQLSYTNVITLNEIFQQCTDSKQNTIIVQGEANSGKTTLVDKLQWDWARRQTDIHGLTDYKMLLTVEARYMKPEESLFDYIQRQYLSKSENLELVMKKLPKMSILIIIDDYDTLNREHQSIEQLRAVDGFANIAVLMTVSSVESSSHVSNENTSLIYLIPYEQENSYLRTMLCQTPAELPEIKTMPGEDCHAQHGVLDFIAKFKNITSLSGTLVELHVGRHIQIGELCTAECVVALEMITNISDTEGTETASTLQALEVYKTSHYPTMAVGTKSLSITHCTSAIVLQYTQLSCSTRLTSVRICDVTMQPGDWRQLMVAMSTCKKLNHATFDGVKLIGQMPGESYDESLQLPPIKQLQITNTLGLIASCLMAHLWNKVVELTVANLYLTPDNIQHVIKKANAPVGSSYLKAWECDDQPDGFDRCDSVDESDTDIVTRFPAPSRLILRHLERDGISSLLDGLSLTSYLYTLSELEVWCETAKDSKAVTDFAVKCTQLGVFKWRTCHLSPSNGSSTHSGGHFQLTTEDIKLMWGTIATESHTIHTVHVQEYKQESREDQVFLAVMKYLPEEKRAKITWKELVLVEQDDDTRTSDSTCQTLLALLPSVQQIYRSNGVEQVLCTERAFTE